MKVSRLPVLFLALLLVALPAAADMRGIPAADGHPQATLEGTITSVNVPFAGGGPIVTLLGGLVHFDATGATVRFSNGSAATTNALAAGQRILALLDPASSPLKATTVVILSSRADVTFTGKVEAVDLDAGTLTVLGFVVKVTDRTGFGGPWEGTGRRGLDDVAVGDLVLVDARDESGALVAIRVMLLSPSHDTMVRLHGKVDSIGTEAWTILGADGAKTVVKIGPETKIAGDPIAGDEVDVLARRQSDGSLLAVLIAKSVPPPATQTERFEGIVKEITATSLTIGPKAGDRPDRIFAVNSETKIVGEPKVGDEVGVVARKQADGSWLALVIAKTESSPGRTEVAFDGLVESVSPGLPAGGGAGGAISTWVVGGTKVIVTPMTTVTGNPKAGDRVHVEGWKMPDASVAAKKIEKL